MGVQWEQGIYRGGVLLAPMLSLERVSRELVNRILRPISSLMNIVAPTLAIVKVTENTMFPKLQEEFNVGMCAVLRCSAADNSTAGLCRDEWAG